MAGKIQRAGALSHAQWELELVLRGGVRHWEGDMKYIEMKKDVWSRCKGVIGGEWREHGYTGDGVLVSESIVEEMIMDAEKKFDELVKEIENGKK